jgi:hypothetical protein
MGWGLVAWLFAPCLWFCRIVDDPGTGVRCPEWVAILPTSEPAAASPVRRGDHVRVLRHGLYHHHGVYDHDGRVVQFGGVTTGKFRPNIEEVTLAQFEDGGTAELVPHPQEGRLGWLPEADDPDVVMERAA